MKPEEAIILSKYLKNLKSIDNFLPVRAMSQEDYIQIKIDRTLRVVKEMMENIFKKHCS